MRLSVYWWRCGALMALMVVLVKYQMFQFSIYCCFNKAYNERFPKSQDILPPLNLTEAAKS